MEKRTVKIVSVLFAFFLMAFASCSNGSDSPVLLILPNENSSSNGASQTPAPVAKNSDGSYTVTMENFEATLKAISEAGETSAVIIVNDSVNELTAQNSIREAFKKYGGVSVSLTLPSCETIGVSAFWGQTSIKSLVIPSSVKTISAYAFKDCSSLVTIDGGDGVTSIGESAFEKCSALKTVALGSSLTAIGNYAFQDCSSLESLVFPKSLKTVGEKAFISCSALKSVKMNGCSEISNAAFQDCSQLSTLVLSDDLRKMSYDVFRNCSSLTSVTIPSKVWYVGFKIFDGCEALANVYFAYKSAWYYCESILDTSGTDISVTNAAANAANLKDSNGAWNKKALKNHYVTENSF